MSEELKEILEERGANYGPFSGHALAAQGIKQVMQQHLEKNRQYWMLSEKEKALVNEGLSMIAHKIGRLVNGDPKFADSWVDIAGYATITNQFLNKDTTK